MKQRGGFNYLQGAQQIQQHLLGQGLLLLPVVAETRLRQFTEKY